MVQFLDVSLKFGTNTDYFCCNGIGMEFKLEDDSIVAGLYCHVPV